MWGPYEWMTDAQREAKAKERGFASVAEMIADAEAWYTRIREATGNQNLNDEEVN